MWLCLVKLKYRAFFSLLRRPPIPSSTFSAPTESKRTTSKAENMASKRNHVVEPGIEAAKGSGSQFPEEHLCQKERTSHAETMPYQPFKVHWKISLQKHG